MQEKKSNLPETIRFQQTQRYGTRKTAILTAMPLMLFISVFFVFILQACEEQEREEIFPQVHKSSYNNIIIAKEGDIIFFRRIETGAIISAIDLSNPPRQIIPYLRTFFAPVFFKADPKRVLSIGLGAGAFNRLFNKIYPTSVLVSVEIDPMMAKLASQYTGFSENEKNRVYIRDGRMFLHQENKKWDWIILDAFIEKSQVPPHLITVEFYELVAKRLTSDGAMVSNLHFGIGSFNSYVTTLKKSFPQVLFFRFLIEAILLPFVQITSSLICVPFSTLRIWKRCLT